MTVPSGPGPISAPFPGDLEVVPDLSALPRPRARKPSPRKGRRAEQALVRAERAARRETRGLAPVAEIDAVPHVRLGLVWAVVTVGAALAGEPWLALELGVVAAVAAGQACAVWRRHGSRPCPPVAMAAAFALPVAAMAGTGGAAAVVAALIGAALIARLGGPTGNAVADAARTVAAAVPVGLAAAAPIFVQQLSFRALLALLALVLAYDAGAYVAGAGAASWWEGPAAGAACTVPVTLLVAAVWVPPFEGMSPWVLGALVAVTAPLGPLLAATLLGAPGRRAPALGRLDSLLVTGPVWAWSAAGLLA